MKKELLENIEGEKKPVDSKVIKQENNSVEGEEDEEEEE